MYSFICRGYRIESVIVNVPAGNAVILKPPTQGSVSALHLAQCFVKGGLPAGLLSVITGKCLNVPAFEFGQCGNGEKNGHVCL